MDLSEDLTYTQDTFDLKINGAIEFDYIVDPTSQVYTFADYSTKGHYACEVGNLTPGVVPSNPYSNCQNNATAQAYSNISTSNNVRWKTNIADAAGEYDIQIYHFNITEVPNKITNITPVWEGYTSNPTNTENLTFRIWNASSSSWYELNFTLNGTKSVEGELQLKQVTGNLSDFVNVSSTGNWVYFFAGFQFSCPFVYSYDGENWTLEHESFPFSVIKSAEATTYDRLQYLKEVNGTYNIQIREELDEKSYVDSFNFYVVDHKGNGFVMPDTKGGIHTIQELAPPISCFQKNGTNCLEEVSYQDEIFWKDDYKEINNKDEETWRDYIELTFEKPKNANEAKLFVNIMKQDVMSAAWQYYISEIGENNWETWQNILDTPLFSKLFKDAFEESVNLKVEIWDGDEWIKVGSLKAGRHMKDDFLFSFDVSEIKEDELKVRFSSTTGFYEVHYTAIDYSEDEEMIITKVNPSSIVFNNKTNMSYSDFVSDSNFIMLEQGDIIEVSFDSVEEIREMNRDYVFDIEGYYNFINFENKSKLDFVKGTKSWVRSLFDPMEIPRYIIPMVKIGNSLHADYIGLNITSNTVASSPVVNLISVIITGVEKLYQIHSGKYAHSCCKSKANLRARYSTWAWRSLPAGGAVEKVSQCGPGVSVAVCLSCQKFEYRPPFRSEETASHPGVRSTESRQGSG